MTINKTNNNSIKNNQFKTKLERIRFKINKSDVIGESQYSILYKLDNKNSVWISKKIVFSSEYTNFLTVSPAISSTFKCMGETGEYELRAEQLKSIAEEKSLNE